MFEVQREPTGVPQCISILVARRFTRKCGGRRLCPHLLPPLLDGAAVSVCSSPFTLRGFALTKDSTHRTQSSNLASGLPPPSYGAVPPYNGTPSIGSYHGPPPHSPRFAAPGPAPIQLPGCISHPTDGTSQNQASVISRELAFFLLIVLLLDGLIVWDAAAKFMGLGSMALRESRERSALVAERARSEQERVKREQDRV